MTAAAGAAAGASPRPAERWPQLGLLCLLSPWTGDITADLGFAITVSRGAARAARFTRRVRGEARLGPRPHTTRREPSPIETAARAADKDFGLSQPRSAQSSRLKPKSEPATTSAIRPTPSAAGNRNDPTPLFPSYALAAKSGKALTERSPPGSAGSPHYGQSRLCRLPMTHCHLARGSGERRKKRGRVYCVVGGVTNNFTKGEQQ